MDTDQYTPIIGRLRDRARSKASLCGAMASATHEVLLETLAADALEALILEVETLQDPPR